MPLVLAGLQKTPPEAVQATTPTAKPTTAPTATVIGPSEVSPGVLGAAAHAIDLISAWPDAGAPEIDPFDCSGINKKPYQADFEQDILPLFTQPNLWLDGQQACRWHCDPEGCGWKDHL